MAKTGINLDDIGLPILQGREGSLGWSLCIGAGTSRGIFPDWGMLVHKLIGEDVGAKESETVFTEMANRFGLDALIRAAQDRLKQNDEEFSNTLSRVLYADAQTTIGDDWPGIASALSARHPGDVPQSHWKLLLEVIARHYPHVSARGIANTVVSVLGTHKSPNSILSFNAEPLLFALINAEVFAGFVQPASKSAGDGCSPQKPVDRVVGVTSFQSSNRPAYCFCHGLLPIPGRLQRRKYGSREQSVGLSRLVFSESQYLQIASSTFSWQSAVFLKTVMTTPTVFVGVSLADPNMRRWLSWAHDMRQEEIQTMEGSPKPSTTHFWINKRPNSRAIIEWTESAVAHLGVRLVWIDEWSKAGSALKQLLHGRA